MLSIRKPALTPRFTSGGRCRITSATSGGMASVSRRLPAATPSTNDQRFAEHLFEGKPFAAGCEVLIASADLGHEVGIAQNLQRRFQPVVFVDVEQHGSGSTV